MKKVNPFVPLLLFIGLLIETSNVYALKPFYSANRDRIAISGYDVVGYFIQKVAIAGKPEIFEEYQGVKWLFSSEENKQIFMGDPQKYLPQYGGYCAYAMARDAVSSSKPYFFTLVDDKLYLNYGRIANKRWIKNKDKYISLADAHWSVRLAKI